MDMFWKAMIGVICLTALTVGEVPAEEAPDMKNGEVIDCR